MQNKVKEVKSYTLLPGIDTLYFFINCDTELYHKFYVLVNSGDWQKFENYSFVYISKSSSKSYGVVGHMFDLFSSDGVCLCRAIFKDPDKQKQIKNIYIMLRGEAIYSYGIKLAIEKIVEILNSIFGLTANFMTMYPSRVDLNCFIGGFDFSKVKPECFAGHFYNSTELSKGHEIYEFNSRLGLESLYLGSKSSPLYFKIYNKKLEIEKNLDKLSAQIKKEYLIQNGFDFKKPIWNAEFTLKRDFLYQSGVLTLQSLFSFFKGLFQNTFDNLVFYGDDIAKINRYRANRNLSRLKPHPLWEQIVSYSRFDCIILIDGCLDYDSPLPRRLTVKKSKGMCEKWHKRQIIKYLRKSKDFGWDLKYLSEYVS